MSKTDGMSASEGETCLPLSRRRLIVLAAVMAVTGPVLPVVAAARVELLMFDDPGCPWCRRWRAEVGQGYANSPEGKRAPLRTVLLRDGRPAGIVLSGAIRASPTFVLVQDGREVGRITGYGGPDFFWAMLSEMMKKLKTGDRGA